MKYIFLIIPFIPFLLVGCNKTDDDLSSPDFTYEGRLTEIEDGSPKVGWQVALSRYIFQIPVTPDSRKVILGFDTVDENGDFGFEVKVSQANFDEFEPTPFEKNKKMEAFYRGAIIEVMPPSSLVFPMGQETYLPLDRANFVTKLSNWQESQVGQVVNNNLRIYTEGQTGLNARFRVERSVFRGEFLRGTLAVRDLNYDASYTTRSSVENSIGLSLSEDQEYTVGVQLPLNKRLETTFKFTPSVNGVLIDALVFKST
ncbi:MAG: hypothetical protein AB8H12_18670 [Lewinella sp.]